MVATPNIDQEPKSTVITPKIEPLPYYAGPVSSVPHVIKDVKPTVSTATKPIIWLIVYIHPPPPVSLLFYLLILSIVYYPSYYSNAQDMTQLLEYGDIKLIEANNAPYRVPAHYVQLVGTAAPLDIENTRLNNTSPHQPTQIKTEPNTLSKTHQTATDFENLIELNRKQHPDSTAQIAAATATANKIIKFEPKTLGKFRHFFSLLCHVT